MALAGGHGVVEAAAFEPHLGAVALGGFYLGDTRGLRHEDGCRDPEELRGKRYPLGMVAGAGSRHAGRTLGGIELGQAVERAAYLERSGSLEVFRLEAELRASRAEPGL